MDKIYKLRFSSLIMLLLMTTVLFSKSAYSIDCFDCASVRNLSDCNQTNTCPEDHYCYTDVSGIGNQTNYTLGCRLKEDCLSSLTATSDALKCKKCCSFDSCNANLCTGDKDGVPSKWSPWSRWSICDVTCGNSTKIRTRDCNNPAPKDDIFVCAGPDSETTSCSLKSCPVHGGWDIWSSWGSCSVTCGIGLRRRDRSCSNPYPESGGDRCYGDTRDYRVCFLGPCADGIWSSWSAWSTCSASCLVGISERTRRCDSPSPSPFGRDCNGNNKNTKVCNAFACPVVNGHWSTWTGWGSCSVTCDIGTKKRTRTCTNPSPSDFGKVCIGNSEENDVCNTQRCQDIGSVRLVDGAHLYEGRLEVFYDGTWGTVCDDDFDQKSATVVCKMLNFPRNTPTVYLSAHFGTGTLPILLDDVKCNGTESSLFSCPHRAWGTNNCGHGEDVGISCIPAIDGIWSTWTNWETCSVTCGVGTKTRTRTCTNPPPSGSGKICIGNSEERDVCNTQSCTPVDGGWTSWTSWGSCSVTCGVGTKKRKRSCSNPSPSGSGKVCLGNYDDKDICNTLSCAFMVRLVDGASIYEGRLEVFYNGGWGTVCDDSFDGYAATVACRMLTFPRNNPKVYSSGHFGTGTLPVLLDDVNCAGSETSLFSCQHRAWGTNNCGHGEDVGISCIPNLRVRLVGGSSSSRGRVEVSADGSNWGTVCDDEFSNDGAKVVCRMLGYATSNAVKDTSVSAGTGQIYLDNVECNGNEISLTYCDQNNWGRHNCVHDEDVGVICA